MTTTMPTTYRLVHRARPWTANTERRVSWPERAVLVREWRQAFRAFGSHDALVLIVEVLP